MVVAMVAAMEAVVAQTLMPQHIELFLCAAHHLRFLICHHVLGLLYVKHELCLTW